MIEINPEYVNWIKKRFEKPLEITTDGLNI